MQETLHKHHRHNKTNSDLETESQHLESESCDTHAKEGEQKLEIRKTSNRSLIKNWSLMSSIIVYCVVSLQDTAYSEVLFASYYGWEFFFFFGLYFCCYHRHVVLPHALNFSIFSQNLCYLFHPYTEAWCNKAYYAGQYWVCIFHFGCVFSCFY